MPIKHFPEHANGLKPVKLVDFLRREGLSQKRFAEQLGVNQSDVSRMCQDNPKWPRRELMRRVVIATRDEVSPYDYLFPAGKPQGWLLGKKAKQGFEEIAKENSRNLEQMMKERK